MERRKIWRWKQIAIAWMFMTFIQLINKALCLRDLKIFVPDAVAVGDTVTLSCQYDLENEALYLIRWYLDAEEFYRYVPKEEPPARVFEISGVSVNLNKSDANSVTIRSLTRNQTGIYQCEVSADAPLFHTESRSATMLVAVLPDSQPVMTVFGMPAGINNKRIVQMGDNFKVSCISGPSYPAVNFTWSINGVRFPSSTSGFRDIGIGHSWETREAWSELLIHVDSYLVVTHTQRKLIVRCETNIYSLYRGAAEVELDIMDDNPWTFGGKVSPTTDQRGGSNRGDPDNSALTGSAILLSGSYKCLTLRIVFIWLIIVVLYFS